MTKAKPDFFDVTAGGHGCFRPVGEWTLDAVTSAISDIIAYCRENEIRTLLVDVSVTSGFNSPTIAERFSFITKWAESSAGQVTISMVARPEMILEDKFGVLIAANRGLVSDAFTNFDEAIGWLDKCKVRKKD